MRVAIVSAENPARALQLARDAVALEHDVTVVGPIPAVGRCHTMPVQPLDIRVVPGFLEESYSIVKTLAGEAFDAVVFPDGGGIAYCAVRLKELGLGFGQTRMIVHADGPRQWRLERDRQVWVSKGEVGRMVTERLALELADAVICQDVGLADWLRRRKWVQGTITATPGGRTTREALAEALSVVPSECGGTDAPAPSVVVTHHERPEYLRAAVDGFAAQVVPPREVVVVDDGSVSHSARDALDALEAQPWPWPLRVVRAAHGGVHAARNIGFREAASDYVLFFDDDDIPFPDLVGTLAGAQAASGADVVAAGARLFRGRASPVPRAGDAVAIKLGQPYELGLLSNHYGGPVCLWPRALLEDLGGFRDGRVVHEDWELLARASARGARVTAVPDALYWYRQTEGSLVNTNTAAKRRATIAEVAAIVEGSLPTTASLLPYLAAGAYERLEQTKRQHPISAAVGRARRVAASRLARPRRRRRGQGS